MAERITLTWDGVGSIEQVIPVEAPHKERAKLREDLKLFRRAVYVVDPEIRRVDLWAPKLPEE